MRLFFASCAALLAASAGPMATAATPVDRPFETLTCGSEPGRGLCRELRRLESYLVDCDGVACYDLWRAQFRSMEEVTVLYYEVDPEAKADVAIGRMAETTSRKICNTSWTGDPNWIRRLAIAANRTLKALEGLQYAANEPVPYTCTLVVHRDEQGDANVVAR